MGTAIPKVVAMQLTNEHPGLWIHSAKGSGFHSGFYPMPRGHSDNRKVHSNMAMYINADASKVVPSGGWMLKRIPSKGGPAPHLTFKVKVVDQNPFPEGEFERAFASGQL